MYDFGNCFFEVIIKGLPLLCLFVANSIALVKITLVDTDDPAFVVVRFPDPTQPSHPRFLCPSALSV
jgi:hypothetical protein